MNTTTQLCSTLRGILLHPCGGIVGLVDDLLAVCNEHGLQLDWQPDRYRFRPCDGDWKVLSDTSIPKSAFRAILARFAFLCNQHLPGSVSPYGGEGELMMGENTFRVNLTNTLDIQRLELSRVETAAI